MPSIVNGGTFIPLIPTAPAASESQSSFVITANTFFLALYLMVREVNGVLSGISITALPAPPSAGDSNFAGLADTSVSDLPGMVTDVNAVISTFSLPCSAVTTLPATPSRGSDPTNFASESAAFLAAMPTLRTELNDFIAALNAYVPSTYSETATVGQTTTDGTAYGAATNEKGVYSITIPSGGVWAKKVFVKVQDTTAGNKFRPVLYTGTGATDTLVKAGQELVFPSTISAAATDYSVDWNADGSAYFIPAGTYGLGYHTDSNTNIKSVVASSTFWNTDTYSDGPASPFGATSSSARVICVWSPYSVTGP